MLRQFLLLMDARLRNGDDSLSCCCLPACAIHVTAPSASILTKIIFFILFAFIGFYFLVDMLTKASNVIDPTPVILDWIKIEWPVNALIVITGVTIGETILTSSLVAPVG